MNTMKTWTSEKFQKIFLNKLSLLLLYHPLLIFFFHIPGHFFSLLATNVGVPWSSVLVAFCCHLPRGYTDDNVPTMTPDHFFKLHTSIVNVWLDISSELYQVSVAEMGSHWVSPSSLPRCSRKMPPVAGKEHFLGSVNLDGTI